MDFNESSIKNHNFLSFSHAFHSSLKIAPSYFLELHSLDLQMKFLKIREVKQLTKNIELI